MGTDSGLSHTDWKMDSELPSRWEKRGAQSRRAPGRVRTKRRGRGRRCESRLAVGIPSSPCLERPGGSSTWSGTCCASTRKGGRSRRYSTTLRSRLVDCPGADKTARASKRRRRDRRTRDSRPEGGGRCWTRGRRRHDAGWNGARGAREVAAARLGCRCCCGVAAKAIRSRSIPARYSSSRRASSAAVQRRAIWSAGAHCREDDEPDREQRDQAAKCAGPAGAPRDVVVTEPGIACERRQA